MKTNTQHFKEKLETELSRLESELKSVGHKSTTDAEGWEADQGTDIVPDAADDMEVADGIEEFENHTAITKDLEVQYKEVKDALHKIETTGYGVCEICGEKIEEDRLEANPAARTCKKDMNTKREE